MVRKSKPAVQPAAYPKVIVEDGRPTGAEPPLSPAFHERNVSHFIAQRSSGNIWPDDPDDPKARAHFSAGQKALYEEKDMVKAIREYEAAIDRSPSYLKAWVSLAIAYITDNTPDSLREADEVLGRLTALAPGGWLTPEASSIIHQNRAYLQVHYYRNYAATEADRARYLAEADAEYRLADELSANGRIEYLCPWTYVKLEQGRIDEARGLWKRAQALAAAAGAPHLLAEYAAKYAPLRALAPDA